MSSILFIKVCLFVLSSFYSVEFVSWLRFWKLESFFVLFARVGDYFKRRVKIYQLGFLFVEMFCVNAGVCWFSS